MKDVEIRKTTNEFGSVHKELFVDGEKVEGIWYTPDTHGYVAERFILSALYEAGCTPEDIENGRETT